METWKKVPIADFSEHYMISSRGRLFSVRRNKIMAISFDDDGYPHYLLCVGGKRKTITAHRLVAMAFIDNPNGFRCVNHKDENKENNTVENLEWCTVKYNNSYGSRPAKLSKANGREVAQISNGFTIAVYKSAAEAQKQTGVNKSKIRMCCRGERKRAGGYVWKDIDTRKTKTEEDTNK